ERVGKRSANGVATRAVHAVAHRRYRHRADRRFICHLLFLAATDAGQLWRIAAHTTGIHYRRDPERWTSVPTGQPARPMGAAHVLARAVRCNLRADALRNAAGADDP